MSYAVEFKDGEEWIAVLIDGKSETPHLSAADTAAHAMFKKGKTSRVIVIGKFPEEWSTKYILAPETHRVDEHGQVRPIKKQVGTIDMTPTWRAILPYLLLGVENGNAEGRKIAIEELQRMADAADAYNASVKG